MHILKVAPILAISLEKVEQDKPMIYWLVLVAAAMSELQAGG